jgi:membrane protease YdiL (CAAX protease family)
VGSSTSVETPRVLPALAIVSAFMIVAVAMLNSIFEELGASGLSTVAIFGWIAVTWLWYSVEVGVTEEFLFRGLLQSRLTSWVPSWADAIVLTSVIFALAHVPTFYLRAERKWRAAASLPKSCALPLPRSRPISIMMGSHSGTAPELCSRGARPRSDRHDCQASKE